jgi:hypothetical protein
MLYVGSSPTTSSGNSVCRLLMTMNCIELDPADCFEDDSLKQDLHSVSLATYHLNGQGSNVYASA